MPKITMPGQGRAEWYDRGSLVINEVWMGDVIFHASTIRFEYIVPVNRAFFIAGGYVAFERIILAPSPVNTNMQINLNSIVIGVNYLIHINNTARLVGDHFNMVLESGLLLRSGDVIRGITYEPNVGGTVRMSMAFFGTEFDA